jgi:uncharacterized protein DUF6093
MFRGGVNETGHVPIYRKSLIDKYVERYVESNMVDEVSVYRGIHTDQSVLVYHGQARIHRLASPVQMGFGDEPQYMVSGTISLPMFEAETNNPVRVFVNDHVTVDDHWDASMIGRTFRVMHVDVAGQFHNTVSLSIMGSEESPTTTRNVVAPAGLS